MTKIAGEKFADDLLIIQEKHGLFFPYFTKEDIAIHERNYNESWIEGNPHFPKLSIITVDIEAIAQKNNNAKKVLEYLRENIPKDINILGFVITKIPITSQLQMSNFRLRESMDMDMSSEKTLKNMIGQVLEIQSRIKFRVNYNDLIVLRERIFMVSYVPGDQTFAQFVESLSPKVQRMCRDIGLTKKIDSYVNKLVRVFLE